MREPVRLRDDPNVAAELRNMILRAPRTKPLDADTRNRMGQRLDRFLALPLVLTLGLTMKTAAASFAVTAGALTVGAVAVHEVRVLSSLSEPLERPAVSPSRVGRARVQGNANASATALSTQPPPPQNAPSTSESGAVAAFPDEVEATEQVPTVSTRSPLLVAPRHSTTQDRGNGIAPQSSAKRGEGLEQEAAMLEVARQALVSSPADALAIVDEHRVKFPRATLALEREFIRLDALIRLGRHSEARRIAETLEQRGGLYADRVRRLLEKLDGQQR